MAYMPAEIFMRVVRGDERVLDDSKFTEIDGVYLQKTPDAENNIVHIAARHGRVKLLEEAIDRFPELLTQKNQDGNTPLHEAAEQGCKETIDTLIAYLDDDSTTFIYEMNKQGDTPFHVALRSKNMAAAEALFAYIKEDHKQILLTLNHFRETPLHLYVKYCAGGIFPRNLKHDDNHNEIEKPKFLKELIGAGALAIFKQDKECLNPVMRAAQYGRILVVYSLLGYLQVIDSRDKKGKNFLHHLRLRLGDLNAGDKEYTLHICQLILEIDGVISLSFSRDQDGNTPLHLAIMDQDFDLAQLILEKYYACMQSNNNKELNVGIKNNQGKTVLDLISTAAAIPTNLIKVMEQVIMGRTMPPELQRAAERGEEISFDDKEVSHYLRQTVDGRNIIHIALQHNHETFCERAVYRCPSLIYQKDCNGDTPLHIAARLRSDAAKTFLEKSFKQWYIMESEGKLHPLLPPWKVKNLRGQTPLHEAACTSNYNILVAIMIKNSRVHYKSDVMSDVNQDGETCLHLIARYSLKVDEVSDNLERYRIRYELLSNCKKAAFIQDVDGLTPILRAATCGQIWLVTLIGKQYPASINIRDYNGRTVLHHLCTSVLDSVNELEGVLQLCGKHSSSCPEADDLTFSKDHDGNTPLHLAIIHQNFEVAQQFIRYCMKVNSTSLRKELVGLRNKHGKSIINLITCTANIPPNLEKLIKQASLKTIMHDKIYEAATKGDVNVFGSRDFVSDTYHHFRSQAYDGSNIIHISLRHNHISFLKEAMEKYSELIYWKDIKGDTPLHVATRLQSCQALQFFQLYFEHCYSEKEDPIPILTVRDSKGNTYLHEAARSGNYQLIISSFLMDDTAFPSSFKSKIIKTSIKDVNHDGETILHVIARYANHQAKELLEKVSEKMQSLMNMRDLEGFTPVLRAVQGSRLGVARLLLKQNPQSAQIPDNKGRTILHYLMAKVVDFVDDLKDIIPIWMDFLKYPEVNELRIAQNEDGNTPLHLAIIDADFTKVKFLFEKCLQSHDKRELDIVNNDGHTVFDLLTSRPHIPATKELLRLVSRSYVNEWKYINEIMDKDVYQAATNCDVKIFESSEVDKSKYLRQTPGGSNIIHVALGHENPNVVEFVRIALRKFPELSMPADNNGDTPLHLAAKWKSGAETVELLVQASKEYLEKLDDKTRAFHVAPWSVKNIKGSFPIHEALQTDNLMTARTLLQCDYEEAPYRVNDLGETPLHAFAKNGGTVAKDDDSADEFVKQLIEKNQEAGYMRDNEGLTPLLSAARSGRFHVTKAILKHCPQSAYLRDQWGRTFLHLLRFTGEDVDESLAGTFNNTGKQLFSIPEANALRLVQDYEGNTPLHYAIKTGNSIAAIVLTQRCLQGEERKELGLVNKEGQTIPDLLASHDVPNEIIQLIRKKVPEAVYLARSSYGICKTEMKDSANALSVVAALLATITFEAGFQVPGGFDGDDGSPVLLTKPAFITFVVANTSAMCCSMLCLFLLLWVMGIGKIHGSLMVLDISIILLRFSFYLTLLAFTLGVFVVTAKKSLWLGILVCGLCFLTFILTWKFSIKLLAKFVSCDKVTSSNKIKKSNNTSSSVLSTTNASPPSYMAYVSPNMDHSNPSMVDMAQISLARRSPFVPHTHAFPSEISDGPSIPIMANRNLSEVQVVDV